MAIFTSSDPPGQELSSLQAQLINKLTSHLKCKRMKCKLLVEGGHKKWTTNIQIRSISRNVHLVSNFLVVNKFLKDNSISILNYYNKYNQEISFIIYFMEAKLYSPDNLKVVLGLSYRSNIVVLLAR